MGLALEITTSNEWHVLKGEDKFGPYTYVEMIKMLQNNTVFSFDYVWSPHLENWTAVGELSEFSLDRLSRLAEKDSQAEAFNKRSSERVFVNVPVYCHDHAKMWTGTCENLSTGGALILMQNPVLIPGNIIQIHFKGAKAGENSFNCTAEVLTKRLVKQRIQHDTGLHYAVKFLQLLPVGEKQITNWIKENKK
jgi:hypothetical protein